jgi:hypothetical protein
MCRLMFDSVTMLIGAEIQDENGIVHDHGRRLINE